MTKQLLKKLVDQQFVNVLTVLMCLCCISVSLAQVQVNGVLHVGENAVFYVNTDVVAFGTSSVTTTSQTAPYVSTDGKIMLGATATFSTDGTASKFVNGYAGTFNTSETTLALGKNLVYAPIKVTANTNSTGVHATYFNSAPSNIANKNELVTAIADTEYWIVKGEDAIVSLSWRSESNLNVFTSSLAGLTIVGYRNDSSEWQVIDSTPESGATLSFGFIKSTSSIDLDAYSAFAIGEKGFSCFPAYVNSGSIKTWDGSSWIGGIPTLNDPVELSVSYEGYGFECYSLVLGSNNLTLTGGTLEVVGDISGVGKIILNENDGLVQHLSTAAKPNIELTRTTRHMKRFDYVYWGAPVVENVFSQLTSNALATEGTNNGAFDLKYKYVSGVTGNAGGWQTLGATEAGKGFIMRVKQQAPFVDAVTTGTINLKFTGTANNGDVSVAIDKVDGNDTSARNNNLLANPYPSAIDSEKFLTENNDLVDGVIYLWRANTANSGAPGVSYSNADYIAYTKAGAQTLSGDATTGFLGIIASGQGFKVRALASGNVKFTNCMRVIGNNDLFLRTNATTATTPTSIDRFRVSLQTTNGVANQILVAYLSETTLGYDNMYDARMLTTSGTTLFSILENDVQRLAINARPDFINTDEVSIGFTKDAAVTTPMSIAVVDREGVFANNQTQIYLHDSLLNTYHDFANGAYTFTSTDAQNISRFKIVYHDPQLGNQDFTEGMVNAYIKDNTFNLNSSKELLSVQVFDLTGRLVATYAADQQRTLKEDFNFPIAVYVAKIKFIDGSIVSQKLINDK